jgi:hypothetical protein
MTPLFGEIRDQKSLDRHPLELCARTPESVRIASDHRLCASGVSVQSSAWSGSSSPSRESFNCTGSLYGAPNEIGLGGSRLIGFAMSRSIGQPLADDAADRSFGALLIFDAERRPVVVPEIELGEVARQMPFVAMLVYAAHPALEHGKEALRGVYVSVAANPFLFAMVDGFVTSGKSLANPAIGGPLVGHQSARAICILHDDAAQGIDLQILGFHGARLAATLDKSNDLHAVRGPGVQPPTKARMVNPFLCAVDPAVEGLIDLDGLPETAERSVRAVVLHGFANAMADEPPGFEINAENAAELVCAETLLAAAKQVHRLEPNVHRHMALFEDGSDLDGKRLAAGIALVDADPGALAFQLPALADCAAMRTEPSVRPNDAFDIGVSGFFVAEAGMVENGMRHRYLLVG